MAKTAGPKKRSKGYSKDDRLQIVMMDPADLIPYERNPRQNEATALKLKKSIEEFGFKNPVILDDNNVIVAGHARTKAAMMLGLKEIPCTYARGLTEDEINAFRIADNKTAELAGWDYDKLVEEMTALAEAGFDLEFSGFNEAEQLYYAEPDAAPEKPDREAYREYQQDAEESVIQAFNVAIVCEGEEDKAWLQELIGEPKRLKRMYTGSEVAALRG